VLEQNPDAMNPDPLPGYVWLDLPGKVLTPTSATWSSQDDPPEAS
jgi:hypothetical protein